MKSEYKEFIGIFQDLYPEGYCQHLINEFERLVENGAGSTRQSSENAKKHDKNDLQLGLNFGAQTPAAFKEQNCVSMFFQGLQDCYEDYSENFSVLKNGRVRGTHMKMQRTDPGGGYHVWHSEQGNGDHADRVLVYMLYLNSLNEKDGGETEFLYQRMRINPTENTMLIWPATFTHAHRGNTVLGDRSKYIVTGWFYYD